MVTIAVASDLHAAEAGSQESFLIHGASRTPWKQHPIAALQRLVAEEGLRADYLVCPGDVANRCSTAGFVTGWEAIEEIADYLGAEIIGTVGNHDVDSHGVHGLPDAFHCAKSVSPMFPVGNSAATADYWLKGFAIRESAAVTFLIINSVTEHTNPVDARHGSIGDALRENIEDALSATELAPLRVAIVHHHPHLHEELGLGSADVMHGGSELTTALATHGFQLVIHGHKHHPKLSYAAGDPSSVVVFAAGSLTHINYGQLASNTRNLFHVMRLAPSDRADCTVFGTINSWEYNSGDRWNRSTLRSARFPYYSGFGCRQTVRQLTDAVAANVLTRVRWNDVLDDVPCLRYALPGTRDLVLGELQDQEIRVLRDETGEPFELAPSGD